MKKNNPIGVISFSENDFLNHKKDSENKYVQISNNKDLFGTALSAIEFAPIASNRKKMFSNLYLLCRKRLITVSIRACAPLQVRTKVD